MMKMERIISKFTYKYCDINDSFYANVNPNTVWSSVDLLSVFKATYNCEAKILFILKNNELLASMPILYKRYLGLQYIISPLQYYYYFISYYYVKKGKMQRNRQLEVDITSEIAKVLKRDYFRYEMKLSTESYDVRSFQVNKNLVKPLYTFIINTSVRDYSNNQITHIRKADTLDLKVTNELIIEDCLTLLEDRFEQKGIWNKERSDIYFKLLKNIYNHDYIKNYSVYYDEKLISYRTVLIDKNKSYAYDWFAASNPFAMSNGVNSFLLDHIISDLNNSNIQYYDLCGANVPSVAKYKNDFGGELKVYFYIKRNMI